MAVSRIKEITVEIDGDTAMLTDVLKNMNKMNITVYGNISTNSYLSVFTMIAYLNAHFLIG